MAGVKKAVKKPIEQKVRTNRILAVDSLIRAGTYLNATTIARRLEVTVRTAQQDMYGALCQTERGTTIVLHNTR
jgi:predicted DNA-binding transcriptional regulator YafY